MAIQKLDFKFTNQVRRDEQVKKLADKINEIIDGDGGLGDLNTDMASLLNGYSGSNASTKKIYYHPIHIYAIGSLSESAIQCRLQLTILDNNATAYTYTALINKLHSLMDNGALININGYVKIYNGGTPKVLTAYLMQYLSGSYNILCYSEDGTEYSDSTVNLDQITANATHGSVDGVNAIN